MNYISRRKTTGKSSNQIKRICRSKTGSVNQSLDVKEKEYLFLKTTAATMSLSVALKILHPTTLSSQKGLSESLFTNSIPLCRVPKIEPSSWAAGSSAGSPPASASERTQKLSPTTIVDFYPITSLEKEKGSSLLDLGFRESSDKVYMANLISLYMMAWK